MAESKIEVKVSIEKAIHDALCAFAQQLADDHHVEIQSVQFDHITEAVYWGPNHRKVRYES